jgi:hypothetical protein
LAAATNEFFFSPQRSQLHFFSTKTSLGTDTLPLPQALQTLPDANLVRGFILGATKDSTLFACGLVVRRAIIELHNLELGRGTHSFCVGNVHSQHWNPQLLKHCAVFALQETQKIATYGNFDKLQQLQPPLAAGAIAYALYALQVLDPRSGIINVENLRHLYASVVNSTTTSAQTNNSQQQSGGSSNDNVTSKRNDDDDDVDSHNGRDQK